MISLDGILFLWGELRNFGSQIFMLPTSLANAGKSIRPRRKA